MAVTPAELRCPVCETVMEPDVVICLSCGFDLRRRPAYGDQEPPEGTGSTDSPLIIRPPSSVAGRVP
jgi:hypothetical protein